jgi:signal transduction histidine kinase
MREDIPLAVPELTVAPPAPDPANLPGACRPRPAQAERLVDEPRWDAYYAVIFAACVAIVQAGPITTAGRIIATAALAAMVPWYVFVGRPLMRLAEATPRGTIYLSGLVVLFAAAQGQNPNAWFLAFALCPQCFYVTTVRRGMVFVVILNVTAGVLLVLRDPRLNGALTALCLVIFAVAFSQIYSRWMIRVIEQSLERAALITQLESTRAELAAAHHEAGVIAERQRLAGEIHDTLAQGFASIVTLLQAADAGLREGDPGADGARRHLAMALTTARENLAEARTLVTALSPAQLESSTLAEALCRVSDATAAAAGLEVTAEATGTARRLPTGTEVVLLRVCQEALANVRKHAAAGQVSVRLSYADAKVRLTVADDGAGFDVNHVNGGYGLRGMRERVRQVGGTIQVRSAVGTGAGTEISVEVPG